MGRRSWERGEEGGGGCGGEGVLVVSVKTNLSKIMCIYNSYLVSYFYLRFCVFNQGEKKAAVEEVFW